MNDEHYMTPACQGQQCVTVERHQRAQVEDARLDSVGGESVRDPPCNVDVRAVGHNREVVPRAAKSCAAEGNRNWRRGGGMTQNLPEARIAIEGDVFVIENRI